MRRVIAVLTLVAGLAVAPLASASSPLAAYTLVVPRSVAPAGLEARAVLPAGARCPTLDATVDGTLRHVPMVARRPASTTGAAFASLFVCRAALPAGATRATVGAVSVPAALPGRITRVALLADTGCSVPPGKPAQDCASAAKWPLARVAASIARSHPDLVMHIGDYFYREGECSEAMAARCGTSPGQLPGAAFDDSAYGWLADAILPMSPLFAAAPIVMTRGNHEACDRAGNGWYLFFDPWPDTAQRCAPDAAGSVPTAVSPTWVRDFPLGNGRSLHIAVVDSAYGNDPAVSSWLPHQEPLYAAAEGLSPARPGRESWLITHRPIFGSMEWLSAKTHQLYWTWISADQTAAALPHLAPFSLILGSHIHAAEANQLPGMPGQLVIGNSGTELTAFTTPFELPAYGPLRNEDGTPMVTEFALPGNATSTWNASRFGWILAIPGAQAGQWRFSQRSPNGVEFARCGLAHRTIACG